MVADIFPESPILITLPRILKNEAETLAALCGAGVSVIHIRKPEASEPEIEELLKTLQALGADMSRLTIHYNEPLARKYGLGGVHLRIEELLAGAGEGLRRSCSAHGWTEAERAATDADYVFLSPLFDSISKPGYHSAIDPAEAAERLRRRKGRIVALGGIRPANIARVRRIGFDGAAVLGAAWSADEKAVNTERTLKNYHILNRKWKAAGGTLQLISDGDLSVAAQFLDAGGRWIQLRMKDASAEVIVCRGKEMLALCRKRRAVLVVNDAPQLAVAIGADGVHLYAMNDANVAAKVYEGIKPICRPSKRGGLSATERLSVRRPTPSNRSQRATTAKPTTSDWDPSVSRQPRKTCRRCSARRVTARSSDVCGRKISPCRSWRSAASNCRIYRRSCGRGSTGSPSAERSPARTRPPRRPRIF